MTADLSFIHLITGASLIVQIVMAILLLASVFSWAVIYGKSRQYGKALKIAKLFEQEFWSTGDISDIYSRVNSQRGKLFGLDRVFAAGYSEFGRLRRQTSNPDVILDGSRRAMRIAVSREQEAIETNLTFLATIGSTSPYIGLFGTVWGIMNSFSALGNVQQATLAMVAPGIAEALIATAMGLFAAIPAVVFYNRLSTDADRLLNRYETFSEEFSTVLQRQAIRIHEKSAHARSDNAELNVKAAR
ncbi:MAG: protein TolQ [Gammaproteobacteria bacterium]|nr:protein TolQ [Gammaproteobacteria bacterium]